jgi:hypothetical protein
MGLRKLDLQAEKMVGAKPWINPQQLVHTPDEQASADEHDDSQRDFGHHQRAAETAPPCAGRSLYRLPSMFD